MSNTTVGGDPNQSLPTPPSEQTQTSSPAANAGPTDTAPTDPNPTEETTQGNSPELTATEEPTGDPSPEPTENEETAATDPPAQTDGPPTTEDQPTTTDQPPNTDESPGPALTSSSTVVVTDTEGDISTVIIVQTTTRHSEATTALPSGSPSGSSPDGSSGSSGGLSTGGKIAIAVVVPIAAVALLFIVGLFFWRKRRARKHEEEQRKQDLKDYAYNPNDPTIPPLDGVDSYEMKEDTSAGYRGWGTSTLASSVGLGPSTTMSGGGAAGQPYSDMTTLLVAPGSDSPSGEHTRSDGADSPEGEILGAMGPPASHNRNGDIRRGPSNASSRYSAGAGSEDSEGRAIGIAYGTTGYPPQSTGYEQYSGGNPYSENPYAFAPAPPGGRPVPDPSANEAGGQAIIRDNPSRRTAQIRNSPNPPQLGISHNF